MLAIRGYDQGIWPPQRCSPGTLSANCSTGNSSVEPYTVMHLALLAHASAAKLYRQKYQETQRGLIGLNLYTFSYAPMTNSIADAEATKRAIDFYTGWEMDPLVFPEAMKKTVGSRMPSFTANESKLVKGSADFIDINHYITFFVSDAPPKPTGVVAFNSDMGVQFSVFKNGAPLKFPLPPFIPYNPSGLQSCPEYFKDYYGNPPIYVQENGYGSPYDENLNDSARIDYLTGYIGSTLNAVRWCSSTLLKRYYILCIRYRISPSAIYVMCCNIAGTDRT
ncbi:hypothetical protein Sjap_007477 [Stephania japonica]|uniref:Beta-glucosidase n=1 Tax=Stephania japonica TaxID=461633 RepID=A0AAP0PA15_9MAGN